MFRDVAILGIILSAVLVADQVLFDGKSVSDNEEPDVPNLLTLE